MAYLLKAFFPDSPVISKRDTTRKAGITKNDGGIKPKDIEKVAARSNIPDTITMVLSKSDSGKPLRLKNSYTAKIIISDKIAKRE